MPLATVRKIPIAGLKLKISLRLKLKRSKKPKDVATMIIAISIIIITQRGRMVSRFTSLESKGYVFGLRDSSKRFAPNKAPAPSKISMPVMGTGFAGGGPVGWPLASPYKKQKNAAIMALRKKLPLML